MTKHALSDYIIDKDEENESLLIHDIARLFKRNFDRRVKAIGLTRAQWLTISTLRRNPGISQSELAEKLDIEPISAARTIDRLEKSGWIERRPDSDDRRVNRLSLTERVQDVVVRMRALAIECRLEAADGLSQEEHQQLVTLLKKIKTNLCDRTKK